MASESSGRVRHRLRLRVRFPKPLTSDETKRTFQFEGRSVDITSQDPKESLSSTTWFLFGASGFETEQEAHQFGDQLRQALIIAGLASRLGVDAGSDKPTSWVNEDFARSSGLLKADERLAPNVHGLMVIPDDGRTRFPIVNTEAKVTADPNQIIGAIVSLLSIPILSPALREALILMNMAVMNTQPIAQLTLAISTVESLAQDERWTEQQRVLIGELAAHAEIASAYDEDERREVAEAMRRTLHRIGLRQGVLRVLRKLDLIHLKKEWDRIYSVRSGLFHGTGRPKDEDIPQLALEAVTLCGTIVLTLAKHEGLVVPAIAFTHFPSLGELRD